MATERIGENDNRNLNANYNDTKKRTRRNKMNRKTVVVLLLLIVILAGAPEAFAKPLYFNALTAVYGDGSCGTCHVNPNGGGPRNSYGTLFENQPNHRADPGAALTAIGSPFSSTTPLLAPTDTMPPATTDVPTVTDTILPSPTDTPVNTATTEATTVTPAGTPTAPGFGIVFSLVGLFAMILLAKRHDK
jgi:hypothetical protein